jgi:DNA-binding transcriptional LysR family regulator
MEILGSAAYKREQGGLTLRRPAETELEQVEQLSVVAPAVEFRELRYFVVLCEELHFGRAAERLHISQSPLSQAIAQLERKVGTRLLDRSSRHVQLTPAGEVLLEHARRLLREADDAIGATRRAAAGETGLLRMAVGPVSREAILPALRHAVDDRLPTLDVEITQGVGDAMVDEVLQGASDVALMVCPPVHGDIETKLLRRDRPRAVFRPDHPLAGKTSVSLDQLAQHMLVLWPRAVAKGSHDVVLAMFHARPPASTRIADLYSGPFWDAMRAGGFSVVAASAPVGGDFVSLPIDDAEAEFTVSMVWSRQTPPAMLPALVEAADAAIAVNGWL